MNENEIHEYLEYGSICAKDYDLAYVLHGPVDISVPLYIKQMKVVDYITENHQQLYDIEVLFFNRIHCQ
mgnify:CR=1 FL=1